MHTVGPGIWQKKTEKFWKWKTHTIECEIWRETLKNMKNEKNTLKDQDFIEKTKKKKKTEREREREREREKWDTNTVWSGIRRETMKMVENEKCTL